MIKVLTTDRIVWSAIRPARLDFRGWRVGRGFSQSRPATSRFYSYAIARSTFCLDENSAGKNAATTPTTTDAIR